MKLMLASSGLALVTSVAMAAPSPEQVQWETYTIAKTGTSVDVPISIFTEKSALPGGSGETFNTVDGRAVLTVQTAPNFEHDTPASFLEKQHPPKHIQYKRVTSRFVAVSGYKQDKVYYSRCNFSGDLVHCVIMSYPAREERDWDDIVTRISLSLSGR
jgi:hypothetical protein